MQQSQLKVIGPCKGCVTQESKFGCMDTHLIMYGMIQVRRKFSSKQINVKRQSALLCGPNLGWLHLGTCISLFLLAVPCCDAHVVISWHGQYKVEIICLLAHSLLHHIALMRSLFTLRITMLMPIV